MGKHRDVTIDEMGLENSDGASYYLNVVPDQPPKVEIKEPRSGAFKSNLSRISFEVDAKDDFKVESLKLVYKVYRSEKVNHALLFLYNKAP